MLNLSTDKIQAEIRDGVGWLTINNPDRRNAMSLDMWEALGEAITVFGRDPDTRCVVLSGAGGKAFASGPIFPSSKSSGPTLLLQTNMHAFRPEPALRCSHSRNLLSA